jgi:hypothetical protein
MEIQKAIYEVDQIGYCYFYDQYGWIPIEQIIDQIRRDISGATILHIKGGHWTNQRDGLLTIVEKCNEEILNQYLVEIFGIDPVDVGGSRKFLTYLAEEIDDAIRIANARLRKESED